MISVLNTNRVQIQQPLPQTQQQQQQQQQQQLMSTTNTVQTIQMRSSASSSVSFGSLNVDENSSTPYTDATQVRLSERKKKKPNRSVPVSRGFFSPSFRATFYSLVKNVAAFPLRLKSEFGCPLHYCYFLAVNLSKFFRRFSLRLPKKNQGNNTLVFNLKEKAQNSGWCFSRCHKKAVNLEHEMDWFIFCLFSPLINL